MHTTTHKPTMIVVRRPRRAHSATDYVLVRVGGGSLVVARMVMRDD